MQQQPVRSLELVDQPADFVGGLDRDRFGVPSGGHEGQHHHVGVAVHEDVLEEDLRALRIAFRRVDEVALDVEDELLPGGADLRARELHIQHGVAGQLEEAAGPSGRGVGRVEGQQRAGCATGRGQECSLRASQPLRVGCRGLVCEALGFDVCRPQRHRGELAIRGAVELDGKALALRVAVMHGGPPVRSRRPAGPPTAP